MGPTLVPPAMTARPAGSKPLGVRLSVSCPCPGQRAPGRFGRSLAREPVAARIGSTPAVRHPRLPNGGVWGCTRRASWHDGGHCRTRWLRRREDGLEGVAQGSSTRARTLSKPGFGNCRRSIRQQISTANPAALAPMSRSHAQPGAEPRLHPPCEVPGNSGHYLFGSSSVRITGPWMVGGLRMPFRR